jgi:CheY-like chemotaxis protein
MSNGLSSFEILKQRLFTSLATPKKDEIHRTARVKEVLIVDDEEPFLLSIADGLSIYKKYFNLLTATNGAEAIKILKSSSLIDLVVTDLSMPKMDGFELLAYMNRNYAKIPVILMTAFGTPKIEEIVHNMGVFRYLEKPLDINILAENISDALEFKYIKVESGPTKNDAPASPVIQKTTTVQKPVFSQKPTAIDTPAKASIAPKQPQQARAISPAPEPIQGKTKSDKEETPVFASMNPTPNFEEEMRSKSLATFGARTGLFAADLQKMRLEACLKAEAQAKFEALERARQKAETSVLVQGEKQAPAQAEIEVPTMDKSITDRDLRAKIESNWKDRNSSVSESTRKKLSAWKKAR